MIRRPGRQPPPRMALRQGLTLLELLLAVAVTAVVALAIATVMVSVARGLSGAGESRSAMQRVLAGHARVRAYTDAALCMLQNDADHAAGSGFALWLSDDRPGGHVNLTEFRVFWFDPAAGTLSVERVTFPPEWPQELVLEADIELAATADFMQAMAAERLLGRTTSTILADGLSAASLDFVGASILPALRFQLTLGAPTTADPGQTVLLALGLPNHKEPSP